jgi:acyl-CoA synthetase (AMP-forming)/AMP-acid ligase II
MTIIDFFDRGVRLNPQGTAYVAGEESWSYDAAYRLSCRVANGLLRAGFGRETKAGVLAPNDPRAWICVLGVWRAGLAWVPLNPAAGAEEACRVVDGFDCEVLFYHGSMAEAVDGLRPSLPKVTQFVCLDDLDAWTKDELDSPPDVERGMDDVVMVSPTGGTTGAPKGVMNTNRSLTATLAFVMMSVHYDADQPVVNLAALPMTHSAGIFSLGASARGGTVAVLPRAEPTAVLEAIERYRVTELFLAPTVVYRLMDVPDLARHDLSSLRYLLYAAAPMSTEKLRRALELFGPVLAECYGQTEAFAGISFLAREEHFVDGEVAPDSRLASCGRPNPLISVEIRDEGDKPVPVGEPGEICVRGDLVMKGYYAAPEATAETVVDGWLHTGDVGHFDHEGYLFITDRKKDMIISGGLNVYPSEVEQVIWGHPAVQDCAVIGVPHEDWGEAVTAVVELSPGASLEAAELIALCRDRLGGVRAPKRVEFVDSLPRSAAGKVLKRAIREQYWAGRSRQI